MGNEIIKYIEEMAGKELPEAFRQYLASGQKYKKSKYLLKFKRHGEDIDDYIFFFQLNYTAFINDFNEYYGRLNSELVPFATGSGGDLYCISMDEATYGNIIYFSHDYLDASCDCPDAIETISLNIQEFLADIKALA